MFHIERTTSCLISIRINYINLPSLSYLFSKKNFFFQGLFRNQKEVFFFSSFLRRLSQKGEKSAFEVLTVHNWENMISFMFLFLIFLLISFEFTQKTSLKKKKTRNLPFYNVPINPFYHVNMLYPVF